MMADVLIRDIPDDVLVAIDASAHRAGLSRAEYLRRTLSRERRDPSPVTVRELERFATDFADLTDEDVMSAAWT